MGHLQRLMDESLWTPPTEEDYRRELPHEIKKHIDKKFVFVRYAVAIAVTLTVVLSVINPIYESVVSRELSKNNWEITVNEELGRFESVCRIF